MSHPIHLLTGLSHDEFLSSLEQFDKSSTSWNVPLERDWRVINSVLSTPRYEMAAASIPVSEIKVNRRVCVYCMRTHRTRRSKVGPREPKSTFKGNLNLCKKHRNVFAVEPVFVSIETLKIKNRVPIFDPPESLMKCAEHDQLLQVHWGRLSRALTNLSHRPPGCSTSTF